MDKRKEVKEDKWEQTTLFGIENEEKKPNKENVIRNAKRYSTKNDPRKRIIIRVGIKNALIDLPRKFPAYCNPHEASLVELTRIYCRRPYLPDGTIMRELRRVGLANCIDPVKSIYEQN